MSEKEKILSSVDIIVSQTDLKSSIIYANPIFYKIAGYEYGELIGKSHNIIRHKDMPKVIFKKLWSELESKKEVYCFVKNSTKNGNFYWVFAYIRPSFNEDGSMRTYISTRHAISEKAKNIIEPLYSYLLEIEKEYGMKMAEDELRDFFNQNRYGNQLDNDIIYNIQY